MKELDKNSKQESPILFGIRKKQVLKVPDKYFEELPQKLMQITKEHKPKVISIHKWIVYSSTIAALFVLGFFSIQQTNQQKEILVFDKSFNNLTASNLEEELFSTNNLQMIIDFDDEEELEFIIAELGKPSKKLTLYNKDFENFFESEIEYIY